MFGLFKKKEPKLIWSSYIRVDRCNECGKMNPDKHKFEGCCPRCGIVNFTEVSAQFEYYYKPVGHMMVRYYTGNFKYRE